jgi:hypothetical protein
MQALNFMFQRPLRSRRVATLMHRAPHQAHSHATCLQTNEDARCVCEVRGGVRGVRKRNKGRVCNQVTWFTLHAPGHVRMCGAAPAIHTRVKQMKRMMHHRARATNSTHSEVRTASVHIVVVVGAPLSDRHVCCLANLACSQP